MNGAPEDNKPTGGHNRPHAHTAAAGGGAALEVSNVVKKFGATTAVNGLTFTVPQGEVLALLGPNGAGKTTTIEMCEGFITPDSGSIRVLGLDPSRDAVEIRRRIGIMLQGGGAYPGVKVGEMLRLIASYSANPLDPDWLLDLVGLSKAQKTSYRRLSGGQQQRLSLACALVGRPELVFLDEPTAGMDAQSRLAVWELINALRSDGVTAILTTHLMDEAEALADHVVIIDHGAIVAQGTTDELTSGRVNSGLMVETATAVDLGALETALAAQPLAATISANRPLHYRIEAEPSPALIAALAQELQRQDVLIRDLTSDHQSLEEVFLSITGREMRN